MVLNGVKLQYQVDVNIANSTDIGLFSFFLCNFAALATLVVKPSTLDFALRDTLPISLSCLDMLDA